MKFDFLFTLFESSLKNLYKIQKWYLFLHKPKRYIILTTKWDIIDFLTRLLQKIITKRFSWSSNIFSLSWKILQTNCIKSSNWHLFLHKPKRYFITERRRAIIDFLTRLFQKVIDKRSSWRSTFSLLFLKILRKLCIKSNNWH